MSALMSSGALQCIPGLLWFKMQHCSAEAGTPAAVQFSMTDHLGLSAAPAVYVIFGATGGTGSALSHRLAQQAGATVVLVGRDQTKVDGLKAQLGGNTLAMQADVTDSKQVPLFPASPYRSFSDVRR